MIESFHPVPSCPTCQGPLKPRTLGCDPCDVTVTGRFEFNEFASLGPDDLHLLRLFVRTEGRIRDLEAALGLSYPTIKSRLAALRARLGLDAPGGVEPRAPERGRMPTEPGADAPVQKEGRMPTELGADAPVQSDARAPLLARSLEHPALAGRRASNDQVLAALERGELSGSAALAALRIQRQQKKGKP